MKGPRGFSQNSLASSRRQTINDRVLIYVKDIEARFREEPEKLVSFKRVMKDLQAILVCRAKPDYDIARLKGLIEDASAKIKGIFEGHGDLFAGYNSFLPELCRVKEVDDENEKTASVDYQDAMNFLRKVKRREKKIFEGFLTILSKYIEKSKTLDDVYEEVRAIFVDHEDLQEEFTKFMPVSEAIPLRIQAIDLNYNRDAMEIAKKQKQNILRKLEQKEQKLETKRCKDRNHEKYMFKSIQELDLSKCKKCTPSYWFLPVDYHLPPNNRTEHELQILNDFLVSVPLETDHYSANIRLPTQHEKIMFQFEDERFELDMLINWHKSACDYAEDLLNDAKEEEIESIKRIHFLRWVEHLYDESGLDVVYTFHKDPTGILPIILVRLKQKLKKLIECCSDLNRTWTDAFAKN